MIFMILFLFFAVALLAIIASVWWLENKRRDKLWVYKEEEPFKIHYMAVITEAWDNERRDRVIIYQDDSTGDLFIMRKDTFRELLMPYKEWKIQKNSKK